MAKFHAQERIERREQGELRGLKAKIDKLLANFT